MSDFLKQSVCALDLDFCQKFSLVGEFLKMISWI